MNAEGTDETYPEMDNISSSILKAAGVTTAMLPSLTKEDLRDLFPGPEHFLRRRSIWQLVHGNNDGQCSDRPALDTYAVESPSTSLLSSSSDSNLCSPTPHNSPKSVHRECSGATKKVRLISPEYVIYSDSELELVRSTYFEKQRTGEGDYAMPKDLRCRLIRNTVTSMIALKRASAEDDFKYPGSRELTAMAKRLTEYYPMLRDKSTPSEPEWENVKKQLLKRVQNVTTPKKKQGATPSRRRSRSHKVQFSQESCTEESDVPASSPASVSSGASSAGFSSASTEILDKSTPPSSSPIREVDVLNESPQSQAIHYKTLQDMYKAKIKPNKADVAQLLDLEFQARRAFIDADVMKEQDKPMKIVQAYPCFKELSHIIDELHRILDKENPFFTMELKKRWLRFFSQAQFYGVFKKITGPPEQDQVKNALALLKALPQMFPSNVALPKKLAHPSDALIHIMEPFEDPNTFLQSRPLVSPVVIVCETNCILAVGTAPLLIFPKEDLGESVIYLLACYYTFHLTYPKCIATLLSVLQTEVLLDAIHEKDMTTSYRKAMSEWNKFNN